MKKWVIFVSSVALLILIVILFIKISEKDSLTGYATSDNIGLNITILYPAPSITIINPVNGSTYLTNISILLNFTSQYAENIWYNLGSGPNITITDPIYFNRSGGSSHTLYLYANNSNSTVYDSVSFYRNSSKFVIIDDEYETEEDLDEDQGNMTRHPKKGQSTDFLNYSYEEMQSLNGIILDNVDNGKISFNEAINLTNDLTPNDGYLNLNTYTNISFNRIEINSTALPNFNKSAMLALYNLTFTNPRILKDGSVCPSTICTKNSYSGGTLSFNVTGFSIYSAEETPATQETGSVVSSSDGGGHSIKKTLDNFTLNKDKISVKLKQGEVKTEEIIITNTGSQTIRVEIENLFTDFVVRGEDIIVLNPGESRTVQLHFLARITTVPDSYLGKLIVSAENIKREILVAVDVSSKKALFDVKVEIPKKFLKVEPSEEIFANIQIFNLGEIGRVDTEVFYIIKDIDGNIVSKEDENIAVETQTSFVKEIKISSSAKLGDYILQVRTNYNNETASSSAWFSIISKERISWQNIILIIAIIVLIILIMFILNKKR
jgi:hypothetical protein